MLTPNHTIRTLILDYRQSLVKGKLGKSIVDQNLDMQSVAVWSKSPPLASARLQKQVMVLGEKNAASNGFSSLAIPGRAKYTVEAQITSADLGFMTNWTVLSAKQLEEQNLGKQLCPLTSVAFGGADGPIVQMPCHKPGSQSSCTFIQAALCSSLRASPFCPMCKTKYAVPGPMPSGSMIWTRTGNDCEGCVLA